MIAEQNQSSPTDETLPTPYQKVPPTFNLEGISSETTSHKEMPFAQADATEPTSEMTTPFSPFHPEQNRPTKDGHQPINAINPNQTALENYDLAKEPALGKDQSVSLLSQPEMREKLIGILSRIEALSKSQLYRKVAIEERWYQDLRQYHGHYDAEMERSLNRDGRSRVFVGMTRAKTNAWASRLSDMLFPTDDRNWGIRHMQTNAVQNPATSQYPEKHAPSDQVEWVQKLMENQLKASRYGIHARDVIDDACKLGTGIIKGPNMGGSPRLPMEHQAYGKQIPSQPEFERIDPWSFFPDMSAARPEDWEFTFERHLYNRKALRSLAKKPGFIAAEIGELLKTDPDASLPNYLGNLRAMADNDSSEGFPASREDRRYMVWEYHGPLDKEETRLLALALGEDDLADITEDDPLEELPVILWYCQGRILKLALHPMDSGESLYSLFHFERDESSCFGTGVPRLMRDSQAALNAAWRMTLDNAGLAVGPQVVINREQISPADGDWTITPNKVWFRKDDDGSPMGSAFEIYHVDSRQDYLNGVMETALQFIDQETSLPQLAQGEPGSLPTNTATGMSLLMESANVIFRRAVRNWDDDMTIPLMRKLYHWNIQFHPDPSFKGNFEVEARGSSVLLMRHMQGTNLMRFIALFGNHPMFLEMIKPYDSLRRIAQTHMLPTEDILYPIEEVKKRQQLRDTANENSQSPEEIAYEKQVAELALKQREMALKEQELGLKLKQQQHKERLEEAKFTLEWQSESDKWEQGHTEGTLNPFTTNPPNPPSLESDYQIPSKHPTLLPQTAAAMAQSGSENQVWSEDGQDQDQLRERAYATKPYVSKMRDPSQQSDETWSSPVAKSQNAHSQGLPFSKVGS